MYLAGEYGCVAVVVGRIIDDNVVLVARNDRVASTPIRSQLEQRARHRKIGIAPRAEVPAQFYQKSSPSLDSRRRNYGRGCLKLQPEPRGFGGGKRNALSENAKAESTKRPEHHKTGTYK